MLQYFQNFIFNFQFSQQLNCRNRAIMWRRRYEIPFASCIHSLLCVCHQAVSVMQKKLNDISQILRLTSPQSTRYRHYYYYYYHRYFCRHYSQAVIFVKLTSPISCLCDCASFI